MTLAEQGKDGWRTPPEVLQMITKVGKEAVAGDLLASMTEEEKNEMEQKVIEYADSQGVVIAPIPAEEFWMLTTGDKKAPLSHVYHHFLADNRKLVIGAVLLPLDSLTWGILISFRGSKEEPFWPQNSLIADDLKSENAALQEIRHLMKLKMGAILKIIEKEGVYLC